MSSKKADRERKTSRRNFALYVERALDSDEFEQFDLSLWYQKEKIIKKERILDRNTKHHTFQIDKFGVKVVVVGDARSTSVSAVLSEAMATERVNIWTLRGHLNEEVGLTVYLWAIVIFFVEQVFFAHTQIFVVVVDDITDGIALQKMRSWIQLIRARSISPQIFVTDSERWYRCNGADNSTMARTIANRAIQLLQNGVTYRSPPTKLNLLIKSTLFCLRILCDISCLCQTEFQTRLGYVENQWQQLWSTWNEMDKSQNVCRLSLFERLAAARSWADSFHTIDTDVIIDFIWFLVLTGEVHTCWVLLQWSL